MNNRQSGSAWTAALWVLGGVVSAVCGFALYTLLSSLQEALQPVVGSTGATLGAIGVLLLVGAAGAFLIRSWWALLIVPACFLVGWYVGAVVDALQPGRAYRPWEPSGVGGMLGIFALYLLPPVLVGVAVATGISQVWRNRQAGGWQQHLQQ